MRGRSTDHLFARWMSSSWWHLRARLYFRRWRCSCRLAQRFQEFPDAFLVGFRSRSLNGLRHLRLWRRTLRRLAPSLRLFLRLLGDARNQPRDTDDRGDDDENDVLIPVHGWRVLKS